MSKAQTAALRDWILTGRAPRPRDADDAHGLVEVAREQRILSLLQEALSQTPDAGWPEDLQRRLREERRAALVRGVRQLDLASRVEALLARKGLRSLPLKGAALAESLYRSVADRAMDDVDILVLDDWTAAVAVLQDHGFRERGRADHAWVFEDPASGGILELHHGVTSCPGLFPVDADGLWSRSRVGRGQVGRRPSPEDLLVQLSLHAAFQHGFVLPLMQYLDFRRLLERKEIETERLEAVAGRALPAVAASLAAAQAVVGAPVVNALQALVERHLPRGLRRFLRVRLSEPLRLLPPTPAPIARARWELAAGQRLDLLRRTLQPSGPARSSSDRLAAALGRGLKLVARWGGPTLRTWGADAGPAPAAKRTHV
jgi:hypothetical protein